MGKPIESSCYYFYANHHVWVTNWRIDCVCACARTLSAYCAAWRPTADLKELSRWAPVHLDFWRGERTPPCSAVLFMYRRSRSQVNGLHRLSALLPFFSLQYSAGEWRNSLWRLYKLIQSLLRCWRRFANRFWPVYRSDLRDALPTKKGLLISLLLEHDFLVAFRKLIPDLEFRPHRSVRTWNHISQSLIWVRLFSPIQRKQRGETRWTFGLNFNAF